MTCSNCTKKNPCDSCIEDAEFESKAWKVCIALILIGIVLGVISK